MTDPAPETDIALDQGLYKTVDGHELHLTIYSDAAAAAELAAAPRPAIVFFFGGGFVNGSAGQFDLQSRRLASLGMVAATADYRVKSRQDSTPPDSCADGRAALRWLRRHCAEFNIDPERIASAGGSAGGAIAAMAALTDEASDDGEGATVASRSNAAVLFNPAVVFAPIDGVDFHQLQHMDLYGTLWGRSSLPEISAIHHVDDQAPPMLILHGRADTTCPPQTVQAFADRMHARGRRCDLVLYDDQDHGFFNPGRGDGSHFYKTLEEAERFLRDLGWIG